MAETTSREIKGRSANQAFDHILGLDVSAFPRMIMNDPTLPIDDILGRPITVPQAFQVADELSCAMG